MKVILIRFLIGGAAVSAFAVLGDIFKPEPFAGSVQPSQVGSMNCRNSCNPLWGCPDYFFPTGLLAVAWCTTDIYRNPAHGPRLMMNPPPGARSRRTDGRRSDSRGTWGYGSMADNARDCRKSDLLEAPWESGRRFACYGDPHFSGRLLRF